MDDVKPSILALRASVKAYAARVKEEWRDTAEEASEQTDLSYTTSSAVSERTEQDYYSSYILDVSRETAFLSNERETDENFTHVGDPQSSTSHEEYDHKHEVKEESTQSFDGKSEAAEYESNSASGVLDQQDMCISGYPQTAQPADWSPNGETVLSRCVQDETFTADMNLSDFNTKPLEVKKRHKCDICGRSFAKKAHLADHQRIHSGIRPYRCDTCNKSFFRKGDVAAHIRIHSGEKPYKCGECDRGFGHPSDLVVHKRTHSGDKPFKCDECDKSFMKCGDLTRHKRIHSGDRLYQCDVCQKRFARSSSLTVHKRKHSGERPYTCDICDQGFVQSGHLVRHRKKHSMDRLYVVVCGGKSLQT